MVGGTEMASVVHLHSLTLMVVSFATGPLSMKKGVLSVQMKIGNFLCPTLRHLTSHKEIGINV